jgi:hypothetical protein
MARPWVRSLWFASLLALAGCPASPGPSDDPVLAQDDLRNPEFVTRWLSEHRNAVDRKKRGEEFLALALRAQQNNNWSAASKNFAESMIRYPGPEALAGYAHANLRMFGQKRHRDGTTQEFAVTDVAHALAYYEAAFAADSVVRSLVADARSDVASSMECLKRFALLGTPLEGCLLLTRYLAGE